MENDFENYESYFKKRNVGRPRIFETDQDRIKYHDLLKTERKKLKRFILMYQELNESPFEEIQYNVNQYILKVAENLNDFNSDTDYNELDFA